MRQAFDREFDITPGPLLEVFSHPIVPVNSPAQVLATQERLHTALPAAGLAHVVPFNSVYWALSGEVSQALDEGKYNDYRAGAAAVPRFAQQYYNHLYNAATGNYEAIPRQWMRVLFSPAMQNADPATQFGQGMVGHILDVDLMNTLHAIQAGDEYYDDYTHLVGQLIKNVAMQESRTLLPVHDFARYALTVGVVNRIAGMRAKAWRNGQALLDADADGDVRRMEKIRSRGSEHAAMMGWMYLYPLGFSLKALRRVVPARTDLVHAA